MTLHAYVPSAGQPDAAARAAALGVPLGNANLASDPRYDPLISTVPCVICDHEDQIVITVEPTTFSAVWAAHDDLVSQLEPGRRITALTATVAGLQGGGGGLHATSHGSAGSDVVTPAAIGASVSGHTHAYEASGAVATHAAATDPHPTYLTQTEGDGRYRQTATALVDADIPAAIARDAEVTSAIGTHEAAGDPHPGYLTAAEGNAAYAPVGAVTGGALRVATNQTATATAATAVTGMSWSAAANATYIFQMHLSITTSTGTAPTTTWGFTGPASPTAVAIVAEIDTSTSVETSAAITSFTTFAAGAQVASTGGKFHGVIQTAGTAGTVQLTVARGGTTPSMVIAAGSNGFWLRVA